MLRAADRIATPWRNGGGETREVAVFPVGAAWADFHWRISVATVATSGPFSAFPGIDRTLAVLDGALQLTIGGIVQPVQRSSSLPILFDGGVAASGLVIDSPVIDLNLMVRRGMCRGSIAPLDMTSGEDLDGRRLIIATVPFDIGTVLSVQDAVSLMPGEVTPPLTIGARGWKIHLRS